MTLFRVKSYRSFGLPARPRFSVCTDKGSWTSDERRALIFQMDLNHKERDKEHTVQKAEFRS